MAKYASIRLASVLALLLPLVPFAAATHAEDPYENELLHTYEAAWALAHDAYLSPADHVEYAGESTGQSFVRALGANLRHNMDRHYHAVVDPARETAVDPLARKVAHFWGPGSNAAVGYALDAERDARAKALHYPNHALHTLVWDNAPVACFATSTTTCGEARVLCALMLPHALLLRGDAHDCVPPGEPACVEEPVACAPGTPPDRREDAHPGPLYDPDEDPITVAYILVGRAPGHAADVAHAYAASACAAADQARAC